MRLVHRVALLTGLFTVLMLAALPAAAQSGDVLTPAASTAKAKQLIQQAIQALGGEAYLHARDVTCTGRVGFFGHSGELNGYDKIRDYIKEPDKERTEYSKKRNIIDVFNGKQGWTLDRGGVSEATASAVADFQGGLKRDINYLFRFRLNEPGLAFRYGGPDVVDLKEAEWVEISDADANTIRIAFDKYTHLPIRAIFVTRDPMTREQTEESEFFSNYQPIQGIQTPFQDTRYRNNLKVYQAFYEECQYNTGLNDSFFTRESLDQRWAELDKKHRKK